LSRLLQGLLVNTYSSWQGTRNLQRTSIGDDWKMARSKRMVNYH
jgi:hypothetical protein